MSNILYIVVPCYNEQEVLPETSKRLREKVQTLRQSGKIDVDSRILFVNDGSKDATWEMIQKLHEENSVFSGVNLSRNRGHQNALLAGIAVAAEHADMIVSMDADLQDPPALLPQMFAMLTSGEFDSVATRRVNREGEPPIRSWFARQFYRIINRISDADIVDGARDFRLMKREMVDAIVEMGEYNRFSKGIFGWIGFRTYWLPYENVNRVAGETKWNFWKLLKYAIDGIINFSQAPLAVASWFGMGMTLLSFIAVIFIVVRKLVFGDPVTGWASTACIITFIGGVQLFCMGIMGQYIAKTYMEVKQRPHYIVAESNRAEVTRIK